MSTKFEEHKDYFGNIYYSKSWGYEGSLSGGGSSPSNTVSYREFLVDFIDKNKIKTVYDFGCGDWSFSKLIDWSSVKYTGIEVVKDLIDEHRKNYGSETIKFVYLKDAQKFYRYHGDLLIIKDVLQHWTNDEVTTFLDNVIDNFKYILITNSYTQVEDWEDNTNRNRPLSLKFYPLKKYDINHIFNYGEKEVSIIGKDYIV